MENFENENLEPTLEQEPPKLSAKEYVRQRMAELAEHPEQAPARKIGRPRIHPPGWKRDRKDPSVDPELSALRSAAGKKGAAVIQGRKMFDAERRKYGRLFQEQYDKDLEQIKAELTNCFGTPTDSFVRTRVGGLQDAEELIWNASILIAGLAWGRSYFPPSPYERYMDEFDALAAETPAGRNVVIKPEQWHSYSAYPEICADDVIDLAKYRVNLAELPLLRQLAIRALEAFLEFASKQKDQRVLKEIQPMVPKAERAIPKIKDGTIFDPVPPPEPPTPPRPIEEIWAERNEWEKLGRSDYLPRIEGEAERKLREAAEQEAAIILRKQQEGAAALAQQQRQLLGFDVNSILHGDDVFGVRPTRR